MIIPTVRNPKPRRQGNEPRKPEYRSHGIHGQNSKLVSHVAPIGVVARGEDQKCDGEDRPDTAEDEEVDLAGGRGVVVV